MSERFQEIVKNIEDNVEELTRKCLILSISKSQNFKYETAEDSSSRSSDNYYLPPLDCGHVCVDKEEAIISPYSEEQLETFSKDLIITYLLRLSNSLRKLKEELKRKKEPCAMKIRRKIEKTEEKKPEYRGKCDDCLKMFEYVSSIENIIKDIRECYRI